MTKEQIRAILTSITSWPEEDQEELAEIVRAIEARRAGFYALTEDERTAVEEGLAEAERGEFVSDQEMQEFWARHGVK